MKCRAKSLLSDEETKEVTPESQYLGNGWVQGFYVDNHYGKGYIVGDVIEASEEYITLDYWIPVDIKTVEFIRGGKQ